MSHPEEPFRRRGIRERLGGLLAGLAVVAGISLAGGCINLKVDKNAVNVPGFTWPAENGEENDKPRNPDQLP